MQKSSECRHCHTPLVVKFVDLGATPVSNDYLPQDKRDQGEPYYPLRAFVCSNCRLVQLQDFKRSSELFTDDYAYFSSLSSTWVGHAKRFVDTVTERLDLTPDSFIVEVGSNDGYLLQFFAAMKIPVLGIEPSRSVADYAIKEKGIQTIVEFFGRDVGARLVGEHGGADLTVANNVLAHVPDINDFVQGFRELLKPRGVATFEFPHLLNLIRRNQFDTIYHEHYSYISLVAADRIFRENGLRIFDVEEIPTHGGSLRLFTCRADAGHVDTPHVADLLNREIAAGLTRDETYLQFAEKVRETKRALLSLLIEVKRAGKTIVAYGAPAKGNTLLNYCGIGSDFIEFTSDLSPQKQGMLLPGTRLEIRQPSAIDEFKPDFVLILPWNIQEEIMGQLAHIRRWGGRFIVPIPIPTILP